MQIIRRGKSSKSIKTSSYVIRETHKIIYNIVTHTYDKHVKCS